MGMDECRSTEGWRCSDNGMENVYLFPELTRTREQTDGQRSVFNNNIERR